MMKVDGKWGAYDVSGDAHKCQKQGWKGPQKEKVWDKKNKTTYTDKSSDNAELDAIIDDIDRMHKILNNLQSRLENVLK